jgi:hypothetical protein
VGLQTEDANVRRTITNDEVLQLPQVGRDPYELARLAPGVFGAGARDSTGGSQRLPNTAGPGGSNSSIFQTENAQPISANGQRVSANNYQIDGTSVNSQTWGGAAVITPSQESVKEVQVTSSTYSAEDGRNSGAQIKVVSQNGTNQFHGSGFFKLNDPKFNAFNKMPLRIGNITTQGPQRVENRFKSYGGSVGGPIVRDRLFFFFSYEGLKSSSSNTFNTIIDTPQFRQSIIAARPGTITANILSAAGVEPRVVNILAPSCVGIFVPCQIVGNGMDIGSITGTYGQYVSLDGAHANGGGLDGIADLQVAQLASANHFTGNQYFFRTDYNLTKNDAFAFTSYFTPVTAFTSDNSAQSRPMADINSKRFNYALGFIYTKIFSARLINEARFNITRWGFNEVNSNPNSRFDLPRVEIQDLYFDRLRYGAPWSLNTPGDINERQLDFRDAVSFSTGNHAFKFGAEFRLDLNRNGEIGGARTFYTFVRPWNFANGTPIFEQVAENAQGKPSPNNTSFHTGDLAFYVQDDWKFRPNLTLNLGLRWEYFSPITANGSDVIGNLQLDSNGGLAGAAITTNKRLTDRDLNNFGPQLGFAWSPTRFDNKLVIRGGGGIGYERLANSVLANARRNPPNGAFRQPCCGTAVGDFSTPFDGGRISYVMSTDGTIFGYPANPGTNLGVNANGLPNSGDVEIYGAPRKLPNGEVYRYSLEAQYEMPWKLVGTLGYQGSQGRRFVRLDPITITSPTPNPLIRAAFFARPDVNSNYNALLANLRSRFYYGLNFNVNYRYSKSLDTTSWESPCACTNQTYPLDQREEHGPSDFDVRHYIVGSVIWDIPIFRNQKDWTGKLLGGWEVSSIFTHHTGFPWTPTIFASIQGVTSIVGRTDPIRPIKFLGGQPLANTNGNFLQPGGIFPGGGPVFFSTATNGDDPRLNRPGIGRNVFFGPKYSSVDMSFVKRFGLPNIGPLREGAAFEIKVNFFNIFNTLNLTPFNSFTDSTRVQLQQFGVATSGLAGRTGELQLRLSF